VAPLLARMYSHEGADSLRPGRDTTDIYAPKYIARAKVLDYSKD